MGRRASNASGLTIRSSRARFAVSGVPIRIGRAGLTQALGLAKIRDRSMKIILAVVMPVAIAGLWQYNKMVSAQSEKAAIAAQDHKPFQPVGSRPVRSPAVARQMIASQPTPSAATASQSIVSQPAPSATSLAPVASQFTCDGRTHCSQMRSCAEATYFLQHCPNTQMDGNNDGEPCEQQWCN